MLWVRISIRARCTTLCDKVYRWLATGRWFTPGPPVSSTNKTDHHEIIEILLKVSLNTIKQTNKQSVKIWYIILDIEEKKDIKTGVYDVHKKTLCEKSPDIDIISCNSIIPLVATSADSVPSSYLVRITIAPIGTTFGNLQWRRY